LTASWFDGELGNSVDKIRHTRSVAYSVGLELVQLNKHQISGSGASTLLSQTVLLPSNSS